MRAPGMLRALPFALLCAACSFRIVPDPGAVPDGRIDGARGTPLRKLITIDPAKVTGGQVQFPVWIVLDGDADLKAHATGDGSDIYFTLGDGTPAPFQIQRWNPATGHLEAWVRADLNDVTNTVLELRYGDPSAAPSPAPTPKQVFSSPFAAVWHLDDPLTADGVADATAQHAGTATGLGPDDQVAAQLGGGVDFDGSGNPRINFTLPITGGGDHTISAWVNQRAASGCDTIVTMGNPNTNESRWFHSHYMTGVSAGFYGNDWPSSNTLPVIDGTGWVLLHWTFKSSNRQGKVYLNGMQVGATQTFSSGVNTKGTDGNLGFAPPQWGLCALDGILDEVRIATVERSAGWIATEHANQSSPQTFYTVGAEEPVR
jgi:hypothetical protein